MHDHEDPQEQLDRFAARDESLKEFLNETAKRINTAIGYINDAIADDSETSSSSESDSESEVCGEHSADIQTESNSPASIQSPQNQIESDEDIPALDEQNNNAVDQNNNNADEQNNNNAVEQNNNNAVEQNNNSDVAEHQPDYATMSHDRALNVLTDRHGAEIAEDIMTLSQNMGISIIDSILILSNNEWNLINALSLLM